MREPDELRIIEYSTQKNTNPPIAKIINSVVRVENLFGMILGTIRPRMPLKKYRNDFEQQHLYPLLYNGLAPSLHKSYTDHFES